jgi:hypothetical protein
LCGVSAHFQNGIAERRSNKEGECYLEANMSHTVDNFSTHVKRTEQRLNPRSKYRGTRG